MIAIGSRVRVKPPFNAVWPEEYEVSGLSETGAWQIDGVDFAAEHLDEVGD